MAKKLQLNDYLLLSRGEAHDSSRAREFILENAFEALIGAIYLDQGFEKAAEFIKRTVLSQLNKVLKERLYQDPKSLFQEKAQEKVSITPHYEVLAEWGPDHAKKFRVGVFLGEELVADAEGPSKHLAEKEAARKALEIKKW